MAEKMKVTITVKAERTLLLPTLPNFIRDERDAVIPVEDLTQDQLREIGQKWTEALMQKARDRARDRTLALNKKLQKMEEKE